MEQQLEKIEQLFEQLKKQKALLKGETVQENVKMVENAEKLLIDLENQTNAISKAKLLFLKGKLSYLSDLKYSSHAEELLSRSVKLDPSDIDCWNCLGNCLAEKPDYVAARDCLLGSIAQKNNKEALRTLSIVLRKIGTNAEEKSKNTRESVERAKQAVALDFTDGESWYLLGNGYLSLFFSLTHKLSDLDNALKAYKRAVDLMKADTNQNPDLFFNRGQVYQYLEDFPNAIKDYKVAAELDSTLPAQGKIEELERRIIRSTELVLKKGQIKPKKLSHILSLFKPPVQLQRPHVKTIQDPLSYTTFDQLESGPNKNIALEVRILLQLSKQDPPPSFLVMDKKANVFILSVYHLDPYAQIKIEKDQCTIIDPELMDVTYNRKDTTYNYPLIHIRSPLQLFVNGNLMESHFSHAAIATQTIAA